MEEVDDDGSVQVKVTAPGLTGITRLVSTRCPIGGWEPVPVWNKTSVFFMEQIEEDTQELLCVVLSEGSRLN